MLGFVGPGIDPLDVDTFLYRVGRDVISLKQHPESAEQRFDMGREQSRAKAAQELLHCQQGMDFRGTEPQSRQFIGIADSLLVEAVSGG